MKKTYDVKAPYETQKKTYWEHTGLTIYVKDNGKIAIKDARTQQWYQAFERVPREQQQVNTAPPVASKVEDDVPF